MLLRFDSIARPASFEERAAHVQLRPWQWDLLMAADGRKRLDELARACGIECETAIDLVHECESLGLVEIVTLSLEAYRAAAGWLENPSVPAREGSNRPSVSFDSFDSSAAFDRSDRVEPPAASSQSDVREVPLYLASVPAPQTEPVTELFALETPPATPAAFDERASLFEAELPAAAPVVATPAEPAPAKSVSFSLSATTFGTPQPHDGDDRPPDPPAAKTETRDDLAGAMLRAFKLKK